MNKGFTLVELIAVVTILGLLAIITTPAYTNISTSIKTRNYESKKSTIKAQTLSYVEKYLKDDVYPGNNTNYYCFTVNYLIQNGIISSDNDEEEYIENNISGEKYKGDTEYIKVSYDNKKRKLIAITNDDTDYNTKECTHCDNEEGGCPA